MSDVEIVEWSSVWRAGPQVRAEVVLRDGRQLQLRAEWAKDTPRPLVEYSTNPALADELDVVIPEDLQKRIVRTLPAAHRESDAPGRLRNLRFLR